MAHYLPVLLVSVSANSVTDDLSLECQPRGQVDYLSHDWAEEDVWRSWRNMTRQKNEIANGVRLENASWRTWWKQRNKLQTISPETLNWLKDSDVTWLYGPLHTAGDWAPPKPKPIPTSVDKDVPNSVHDRLGLTTAPTSPRLPPRDKQTIKLRKSQSVRSPKARKSILKHRSITDYLTSDLPPGILNMSPSKPDSPDMSENESDSGDHPRPSIPHTTSDTHLILWDTPSKRMLGAMGLRNDPPAKVDPPTHEPVTQSPAATSPRHASPVSASASSTSLSSHISQVPEYARPKPKHKHITFNTYVEQCIAIEKPVKHSQSTDAIPEPTLQTSTGGVKWNGKTPGVRWIGADEEEEEEEEGPVTRMFESCFEDTSSSSSDEEDAHTSSIPVTFGNWAPNDSAVDSDSDNGEVLYDENVFEDDSEEGDSGLDGSEDDGILEMRPSRRKIHTVKPSGRSQSASSASSTSTTSSALFSDPGTASTNTSPSPARPDDSQSKNLPFAQRPRRRSRRSVPEPVDLPLQHRLSTSSQSSNATVVLRRHSLLATAREERKRIKEARKQARENQHVTIAPIAPTTLKISEAGNSWDNYGSGYGLYQSVQEVHSWMEEVGKGDAPRDSGRGNVSNEDGPALPVSLVYAPRNGDRYETMESPPVVGSPQNSGSKQFTDGPIRSQNSQELLPGSVPIVVRTPPVIGSGSSLDVDPYDYFSGPDLGEGFLGGSGSAKRRPRPVRHNSRETMEESPPRGRSRSRSRSRTPSPHLSSPPLNGRSVPVPYGRSSSASSDLNRSPSSPSLLSPPPLNRSPLLPQRQDSSPPVSRGRSSTRTSSTSLSDRERSSHSSPIGSLSPDNSSMSIASAVAYAYSGGRMDRERESRTSRRDGERGRQRTERRITHSHSPVTPDSSTSPPPLALPSPAVPEQGVLMQDSLRNSTSTEFLPKSPTTPTNKSISSSINPPSPSVSTPTTSAATAFANRNLSSSNSNISNGIPQHNTDGSFVGKAVGMVSTAGVYLGFWQADETA